MTNREVISLSNQNSEMQVGSKWPFWIPVSLKDGDPVETMYGNGYISPGQTVDIMGVNRNCWLLSYAFSAGNNMDRFYDKATGICLDIQTHLFSDGISVNVTETAIQTNLKLT